MQRNGEVTGANSSSEQPDTEHLTRFILAEGGADRALLLLSVDGRVIEAHGASSSILGGDPRELRGASFSSFLASSTAGPDAPPKFIEQVLQGRFVRRRCWCVRRDRGRFWAEVIAAPVKASNGAIIGCGLAIRDLSELKAAEAAAKTRTRSRQAAEPESAASPAAMLDGITNSFFAVDDEWRFAYLNARAAQMLRKPREQLVGASIWDELPVAEGSAFHRQLQKAASERMAVQFEEFYPLLNSWFEVHAYPYSGGVVVYFWDISDRKLEVARVRQQSLHDPLTGVANTILLQDRTATAVARARRSGSSLAMLLVDLDGLGAVNARYGHSVGDLLLQTVATRLCGVVRRSDTIARLGGDEFAILTSDHREADGPALLAEKLLAAAAQTFELSEASIEMTASIGIALFPGDGLDTDALMKGADAALSLAKSQGGNSYRFFSADLTDEVKLRRGIENELRTAITRSDFELWYQPERSIDGTDITAMEALLRWNQPGGGYAMPGEFMPALYSTDVVVEMDRWVLREACRDRVRWSERGVPSVAVTVNVSPTTLFFGDIVGMVRQALEESGLDPALLELEFPHPALLRAEATIGGTLAELRMLGVSLSLDDVGQNGWATLATIEQYPFGKIKLDPTVVTEQSAGSNREAALRAASSFAHAMNRKVVAEHIESAEQLALMRACGCDAAQGHFIGQALRPELAAGKWAAIPA